MNDIEGQAMQLHDFETLRAREGDVIIFRPKYQLSSDTIARISKNIAMWSKAAGVESLLVPADWDVMVVNRGDLAEPEVEPSHPLYGKV